MANAIPRAARVTPLRPRRILIFNQCEGFRHSAIPYAAKALELMGQQTGAFEIVSSSDPQDLQAARLATFDALVINNATMRVPVLGVDPTTLSAETRARAEAEEAAAKEAILAFVRNGKGLVGIHAATDCLYKWPEYGDMIGAYFVSHPWNEEVTVKLDDPGHPLCRAFRGQSFTVTDEIYQFRAPYSRANLRVLLSLDITRCNMDKGTISRDDGDFAVAWIREYGAGRVFYCSLGHHHDVFWSEPLLEFYLDGIQYALGDLPADATPSAQLDKAYLQQSHEQGYHSGREALLAAMTDYKMGTQDHTASMLTRLIHDAQSPENSHKREILEAGLISLLGTHTSIDCKRFACRNLGMIGGVRSVGPLENLLKTPDLADDARAALERIPEEDAARALLEALDGATGLARIGIINSLGRRRLKAATPKLAADLTHENPAIAAAAARALGNLGTVAAAKALLTLTLQPGEDRLWPFLGDALLNCAEQLSATGSLFRIGSRRAALHCYERVLASAAAPPHVRAAALDGMCTLLGEKGLPVVLDMLHSEEPEIMRRAAAQFAGLPGKRVTQEGVRALNHAAPALQIELLAALSQRGDAHALTSVLALAESEDAGVQRAALQALEFLGDDSAIPVLLRFAASPENDLAAQRDAARQSLYRLNAPDINAAISAAIPQFDPMRQCELVRTLAERKATESVPMLLSLAQDADLRVRRETLEALSALAAEDHVADLIDLTLTTKTSGERNRIERLVVGIAGRAGAQEAATREAIARCDADPSPESHALLLSIIGKLGMPAGLPVLYANLTHTHSDVAQAAVRALADWPDTAPMETLRGIGSTAADPVQRVLALRGYARMLGMPTSRPVGDTVERYREALRLAPSSMELRPLLDGLGKVCAPEALELAQEYRAHPEVSADALLASCRILTALDGISMSVSASRHGGNDVPGNAVDGSRRTRWTSGRRQQGDEWFQIDLGFETTLHTIHLDAGDTGEDWPRQYQVYVSANTDDWGDPVGSGEGDSKAFTIQLPAVRGRCVRLVQTGTAPTRYWSIAELQINGKPENVSLKPDAERRNSWQITACSNQDSAGNAIDGNPDTRWHTGRPMQRGDWLMIDLGEVKPVRKVVLNAGTASNDYPRACEIQVSTDGSNWLGPVGMKEGDRALTVIPTLPIPARFVKVVQTGATERWHWSVSDLNILFDSAR